MKPISTTQALWSTASTGDDGYFDWDKFAAANAPSFPSSYGAVVAVGGSSLSLNANGTRNGETVWDDDSLGAVNPIGNGGASGGGCSTVFPAPSWQTSFSDSASTACGSYRLAADVSADADPFTGFDVYDSFSCSDGCLTGWATVGGTSLASPIIASMYALAGGAQGVSPPANSLQPPRHFGAVRRHERRERFLRRRRCRQLPVGKRRHQPEHGGPRHPRLRLDRSGRSQRRRPRLRRRYGL